jgi:DNA-binding beta-propeller fold protein YncE
LNIIISILLAVISVLGFGQLFQGGYSFQGSPLATDPNTNIVYIPANNTIIGVDGDSGRIVTKFDVQARDLVLNSITHELYGFDKYEHRVIQINLASKLLRTTNISNSPFAITLDPVNNLLYAADDESLINLVGINGTL